MFYKYFLTASSVLLFAAVSYGQTATLVAPANNSYAGLEKNLLFFANKRYNVTQTGIAQVNANMLFDGKYMPSYTNVAPTLENPTVIVISNLPQVHTQRGAYVGWTTRYWPANKFKIEAFNVHTSSWSVIADISDYGGYDYITSLSGEFTQLRYTFYTASGDNGFLGLSELFFLHGEAVAAYDGLMVQYSENNNVGVGVNSLPSGKLHVKHAASNIDVGSAIAMGNNIVIEAEENNRSETAGAQLEFAIPANTDGSNPYGQARILTVAGNSNTGDATGRLVMGTRRWYNKLGSGFQWYYGNDITIDGNGNVGINTLDTKSYKFAVNGNAVFAKVVVKNPGAWPDYVFSPAYKLPSLDSVSAYLKQHQHLPDIPAAKQIETEGQDIGEIQKALLQKVEELTLYIIEQNKKMKAQELRLRLLESVPNK